HDRDDDLVVLFLERPVVWPVQANHVFDRPAGADSQGIDRNFRQESISRRDVQLLSRKEIDPMTATAERQVSFHTVLAATDRSPDIAESADVYGWLCGSWDLKILHYRAIDVSARGMTGEVHAARVLEGRAVQDVWIMP